MRLTHSETMRQTARLPIPARIVIDVLRRLDRGGLLLELPDGRTLEFGSESRSAVLHVRDWRVFGMIAAKGDIGFAETYMDGLWSTPDLAALLTLFAANRDAIDAAVRGGFMAGVLQRLNHLLNANTRGGSRRNVAAHYDLGNDFYALWLDPSMTYSGALFAGDPARSLEAAQQAKIRRALGRLALRPGDHILEIGCGWGALAEVAAREYGCRVTGITLSVEQLLYAQLRIARAGLDDRVRFELRDYRDVGARYDRIVSIEMIEAVGERYWPAFFATVARALAPGGKACIQAITIDDRRFDRYRSGTDFIQQYIFPGGMLASPRRLRDEAACQGLAVAGEYAFGHDYAETLRRWRDAFRRRTPEIRALGYDERFVRMWDFYLAYCEAGFQTRCTDLYQFDLELAA
jgi:cyclopropane-fatty-acyl-phospholipid synthase